MFRAACRRLPSPAGDQLSAREQRARPSATEEICREWRERLYTYFVRKMGDADRAEDLAQDVLVAAIPKLGHLARDREAALRWLLTVAHRRFVDEVRRERVRAAARMELPDAADFDPPNVDEGQVRVLAEAMARLSPAQRRVVVGRIVRDLPFAAIADELATSEGACRMRFGRAMRELGAALRASDPGAAP